MHNNTISLVHTNWPLPYFEGFVTAWLSKPERSERQISLTSKAMSMRLIQQQ
jgi:hypothetical protein